MFPCGADIVTNVFPSLPTLPSITGSETQLVGDNPSPSRDVILTIFLLDQRKIIV